MKHLLILLHLFITFLCVTSTKYHLANTTKINGFKNISKVTRLNDQYVIHSSFGNSVLTDKTFKIKIKEMSIDSTDFKVSKEGILVLDKDKQSLKMHNFIEKNTTFLQNGLYSNLLVTQKYALVAQNKREPNPTLIKLDFKTITLQTLTYPAVDKWQYFSDAFLVDLKNGDFGFIQGKYHLFIVDNQTLEIKQDKIQTSEVDYTNFLSTIFDKQKNQTYIFGGNRLISEFIKDKATGVYRSEYRFNAINEFIFTAADAGVNIWQNNNCSINYWKNMQTIVNLSIDQKYVMKNRQTVAVSYDETFAVFRNQSSFYQFYRFDQNYQVTLIKSVYVSYNDLKKGSTTSDDKFLFISMFNSRDKHDIAQVQISSGQFTLVTDTDGSSDNQMDYHLFDAKYNRFVSVVLRGTNKYFLQLRNIDELQLIHQIPLVFEFPFAQIKLIGNIDWDLNFGVALRTKPYAYDLQTDTKLLLFKIQGDQIKMTNISVDVTMSYLQACYQYVVTYKTGFPFVKIFHYSNLSSAMNIEFLNRLSNSLLVEKNILILNTNKREQNRVYDLKKSLTSLGLFDRLFSSNSQTAKLLIFPKKGVLYEATNSIDYQKVSKIFYNISSLSTKETTKISNSYCQNPIYYRPENNKERCNFIFYLKDEEYMTKPQLFKYYQCTGQSEVYKIKYLDQQDVNSFMQMSTDQKYIIILVKDKMRRQALIQIRPVQQLQKVIFNKTFEYQASDYYSFAPIRHVDVINNNMILIQASSFLTVYFMEPTEFADSHGLKSINVFDTNLQDNVAFAGESLHSSKSTVILKSLVSKQYIFATTTDYHVEGLALSPSGKYLAFYTLKSLQIWNTQSKELLISKETNGITKIKFEGQNHLLVIKQKSYEIFDMNKQTDISFLKIGFTQRDQVIMNDEGSMIAETINRKSVKMFTTEGNSIAHIEVPQAQNIISIFFQSSSDLTVITDANIVYTWKKNEKDPQLRTNEVKQN